MIRRLIDKPECGCVTELSSTRMARKGITEIIPTKQDTPNFEEAEKRNAELQEQLKKEQDKSSALSKELEETKAKLKDCEDAKCPEVNVVSLANAPVMVGTSCDTLNDLAGNTVVGNGPAANQL